MAINTDYFPATGGGDQVVVGTTDIAGSAIFSNSNNVSFGVGTNGVVTATATVAASGAAISAGAASASNGTIVFSNSNGVSFGMNGSTVTASQAGPQALSAGAASVGAGTVVFSNSNGVSFGVNGSTVTASHNGLTAETQTFLGGVAAGGATQSAGTAIFSNSNGVTFGLNGSTVTASHNGLTTAEPVKTASFWANNHIATVNGDALSKATKPYFFPLGLAPFDGVMTMGTLGLYVDGNSTFQNITNSFTLSVSIGLYTLENSTRLSLLNSASWTTGSTTNYNNSALSRFGGHRILTVHSSQWSAAPVLSKSNYWLGVLVRSSNIDIEMSFRGASMFNSTAFSGYVGSLNDFAVNHAQYPFFGSYSASTTDLPTAVSMTQVGASDFRGQLMPAVMIHNLST